MSLSDVVVSQVDLSEVEVEPLSHAGRVVGAFFPLDRAEIEVVQSAFEAGAGKPDAYSLVGHGRDGHFWVRRKSDRRLVALDELGVYRLLSSLELPGGQAWRGLPEVMIVSCGANNPGTGGLPGRLRELAGKKDGYRGEFSGYEGRARVRKGRHRIEELTGEPAGEFKGGVGIDENGVPYVDLAPPEQGEPELPLGVSRYSPDAGGLRAERQAPVVDQVPNWLLEFAKEARRDAEIVDQWHMEPPGSDSVVLTEGNKNSMREFARRLLRREPGEGEVPWDIQLHVTETRTRLENNGDVWFGKLKEELKAALVDLDVPKNSKLLNFDFDHIKHSAKKANDKFPSLDILVFDTAGKTIGEYQSAQSLDLSFVPFRADLVAASRRKLHWRVEGLAGIVDSVEGDQSLLVLELHSSERLRKDREASVSEQMSVAAQKVYPEKSDEEIKTFIEKRTTFIDGSARFTALIVDLIKLPADGRVPLRGAAGVVVEPLVDGSVPREVQREWRSWVAEARKKVRKTQEVKRVRKSRGDPARAPVADSLLEPVRTEWSPSQAGFNVASVRRDAEVVGRWQAKPPVMGHPVLPSNSMVELAEGLRRRVPAEGDVPWDIQLHVTEPKARLDRYGEDWFDLLEEELKAALKACGVDEGADLPLFDFDHIKHEATEETNPSIDILVFDTAGKTIREYQSAQSLDLSFIPFRVDLVAASRRKLHWRVEGLAGIVDDVEGDQSLLVLDLRSNDMREGRAASVIEQLKSASQKVFPGKSGEEIDTFINKNIVLMDGTSKQGRGISVDLIRLSADMLVSLRDKLGVSAERSIYDKLPREAQKKLRSWAAKARKAALSDVDIAQLDSLLQGKVTVALLRSTGSESVEMFSDEESKVRAFGSSLGKAILERPPGWEFPDVRITVHLTSGSSDESVRQVVKNYLIGVLENEMEKAGVNPSDVNRVAFTWFWGRNGRGYAGWVSLRIHVSPGEPREGRELEYYRRAKMLAGKFAHVNSALLSKAVEQRVMLAAEGFFGRFIAAVDELPTLKIHIKGPPRLGPARQELMEKVVRETLVACRENNEKPEALPKVEAIMRYARIEWDSESLLPQGVDFSLWETVLGEEIVAGTENWLDPYFENSGAAGEVAPLPDAVGGGIDLEDVEFVELTDGMGGVTRAYYPLQRES
ncbi:hypothetical protein ACFQ68_42985 [Amycolatopsis japonica]|uniref:hypothetical protein n=1 Tax=Amycolatopsis japonica TaxID=208439 RepID=UPI00366EA5B3